VGRIGHSIPTLEIPIFKIPLTTFKKWKANQSPEITVRNKKQHSLKVQRMVSQPTLAIILLKQKRKMLEPIRPNFWKNKVLKFLESTAPQNFTEHGIRRNKSLSCFWILNRQFQISLNEYEGSSATEAGYKKQA